MYEIFPAALIFILLVAASLGALLLYEKMPLHHRQEDTHNVVKLAANIFVVMTSLVLGLLINSAKNTFESVDRNVHAFATELILMDETLRQYGPDVAITRQRLVAYVQQAVNGTWPAHGAPLIDDNRAEQLLDDVGDSLRAIKPDAEKVELWRNVQQSYQNVVRRRWSLVEESEGALPTPLLGMLVAWLFLIYASFGYRAPRNMVVVSTLVVSAFLISGAVYLMLDMGLPFSGPIQISPAPLLRVLEHLQR
jgi:hypothetical protein